MSEELQKIPQLIEISASLSAKIPIANFESYQPFYSIKEVYDQNSPGILDVKERVEIIRKFLSDQLKKDYEKVEVERIENTKQNIRFYDRGDQRYPSVTSIINPDGIDYDPVKLEQYAARGTIVHKQCEIMLKSGILDKIIAEKDEKLLTVLEKEFLAITDPHNIKELEPEVLIVEQGDLELSWEDCNFRGFYEKFGKNFTSLELETELFNDEYRYAGRTDWIVEYKDKDNVKPIKAIVDFKTASNYDRPKLEKYFVQTSAYARCRKDIEALIIIPLNPSNKSGFGSPLITKNIDKYFTKFLEARRLFKRLYGV